MRCHTVWGQWAVELLQCTATLSGGCGQWNSRNALPHRLGAEMQWNCCNALPHRLGALRQWKSCNALPHRLGAVGSGAPAMHCLTAWGP